MNTINEFDLYKKTQLEEQMISNIKVESLKEKFTLSIKENKNSDWIEVVNKKDNSIFFEKPHLLILLKSVDLPFELLKKIEKNESVEFANGIENLDEENGITSFLENSNYISFLKKEDIDKILKKTYSKLKDKEEVMIDNFSALKKDNAIFLSSENLRGNSIKIEFSGDSLFQLNTKRFYILNDQGEEIFSSNSKKFPIEKNIANEFMKLSHPEKVSKPKIK